MTVLVFIMAVLLNLPWEIAEFSLYTCPERGWRMVGRSVVASLGDGVLVLLVMGAGALVFGGSQWFIDPGLPEYAVMLGSGAAIAVTMEWVAVHRIKRWAYGARMPLLPGIKVGVVPVAQMVVLPPLVFWAAARTL